MLKINKTNPGHKQIFSHRNFCIFCIGLTLRWYCTIWCSSVDDFDTDIKSQKGTDWEKLHKTNNTPALMVIRVNFFNFQRHLNGIHWELRSTGLTLKKANTLLLITIFLSRFETKYESNIHRYKDTYLERLPSSPSWVDASWAHTRQWYWRVVERTDSCVPDAIHLLMIHTQSLSGLHESNQLEQRFESIR